MGFFSRKHKWPTATEAQMELKKDRFSDQALDRYRDRRSAALELLNRVDGIPEGVTIRRVKPKAQGNKWSIQYLKGTLYYGQTLQEAIDLLMERNEKARDKFNANTIARAADELGRRK